MAFPTAVQLPPGGGPPAKLEPQSRVPPQTQVVDGIRIAVRAAVDREMIGREADLRVAWGVMFADVAAPEAAIAWERAVDAMEKAVESVSFQLQASLQIHGITAIDVTPPVEAGEEREFSQLSGYPLRRFGPASSQMTGVTTQVHADLSVTLEALDRRQHAALDWYLKALAAQFQVDQFMFLWIAFEIQSDESPVRVEGPLITRCQHELAECPVCGKPTTRVIQGPTRQRYLTETFGIGEDVARELWRARQILHGAQDFDSALMGRLPSCVK
jgi:hypothetical protein